MTSVQKKKKNENEQSKNKTRTHKTNLNHTHKMERGEKGKSKSQQKPFFLWLCPRRTLAHIVNPRKDIKAKGEKELSVCYIQGYNNILYNTLG